MSELLHGLWAAAWLISIFAAWGTGFIAGTDTANKESLSVALILTLVAMGLNLGAFFLFNL